MYEGPDAFEELEAAQEAYYEETAIRQLITDPDSYDGIWWLFHTASKRLTAEQFKGWCARFREQLCLYRQQVGAEFKLPPEGLEILRVLAESPTSKTGVDLEAAIHRTRKTIGPLLKRMEVEGLIHYPYGPRKGAVITDAGRAFLE